MAIAPAQVSRGQLIRQAKMERERALASQKHPIEITNFILLLILALFIDALKFLLFIPAVGVIFAVYCFLLNTILWIIYWNVGAKGMQALITMLLGTLFGPLPFVTTVTAIAVYLVMSPRFQEALEKFGKFISKIPLPQAKIIAKAAEVARYTEKMLKKAI
jgi:hypothetical protein